MGQILVRQLDDATIERLKAREVLTEAATLTADEKLALVRRMQDWGRRAINPAVTQTPLLELIREDRDHDQRRERRREVVLSGRG